MYVEKDTNEIYCERPDILLSSFEVTENTDAPGFDGDIKFLWEASSRRQNSIDLGFGWPAVDSVTYTFNSKSFTTMSLEEREGKYANGTEMKIELYDGVRGFAVNHLYLRGGTDYYKQ